MITFPTGVNDSSNKIFFKLSPTILQIKAGILLDEISYHCAYFISLDVCHNLNKPSRLVKKGVFSANAIQDVVFDMKDCDISKMMNNVLSSDPNLNYDILHDHITKMKNKHLPFKFEKKNIHKQKKNKWISFGILRSIKTWDVMYPKFKRCKQSVKYNTPENNLHVFDCILK